MSKVLCPVCDGEREVPRELSSGIIELIPCDNCDGTGEAREPRLLLIVVAVSSFVSVVMAYFLFNAL